jgi:hypothetical protein
MAKVPGAIPPLPPMKQMRPSASEIASPTAAPWSKTTGTSMREKALLAETANVRAAQGMPGKAGGAVDPDDQIAPLLGPKGK